MGQLVVCEKDGYVYKIHPAYRRNWQLCWGWVILQNGSEIAEGTANILEEAQGDCDRRIQIELEVSSPNSRS